MIAGLRLYLSRQASSFWRYIAEQSLYLVFGWVPTVIGIGLRGVVYRVILNINGWAAIENKVRLLFADNIRLGHGVYLDQNVYLHACHFGDLGLVLTYFQHARYLVSLFLGKLCVGSHECSFDLVVQEAFILPWLTSFSDHQSCTC